MSTALARPVRRAHPPRWPSFLLTSFTLLATLSIVQGLVDVVLPVLLGEPSFGFLLRMTETYGPGFFIAYIFVHNLGLACIVPGFGFAAAYFERRTVNRTLIGILLAGAVVAALLVAAHLILTAPARFNVPFAMALFVGEACGVLALTFAAARELRGFVPTPRYAWSLVTPFKRLKVPLAYSVVVLLLLSVWEAYAVLGL